MQTFFVTYNTGEYDSFYEHVYTFEAETKDDIHQEIIRSVNSYVEYQHTYKKERKILDEKYRIKNTKTASEKQWKDWHTAFDEFNKKFPYVSSLTVFGYNIAIFDDIFIYNTVEETLKDSSLDIMTVDEYIESCRPDKEEK